jgi:hypothetical protein
MYRWSACPGSVRMSQGIRSPSSRAAAEGTCAHELAEACLRTGVPPSVYMGNTRTADGVNFTVDEEMVEAIQLYIDTIKSTVGPGDETFVEHRFDLRQIHDGLFGTADHVTWKPAERLLIVDDFKYGAGICVDVANNPQLRYYGVGALITLKLPALKVMLRITQPRYPHSEGPVRSETFDAIDLVDFIADLKQFAAATEDPFAPIVSGSHCIFCPAAAICPAKLAEANKAASAAFSQVEDMDYAKLAEALELADRVTAWAKRVNEFAYARAEAGDTIPGFKLVEKIARRKWKDEAQATQHLRAVAGLGETKLYPEPVLRSPAQIEEVLKGMKVTPEARKQILEPITEKKSSGHALVPDSDKRSAVSRQSAADAFSGA